MSDLMNLSSLMGTASLWITGASILFGVAITIWALRFARRVSGADLRKRGVQAAATVLEISDTGTTVNGHPVARLQLQVELPGQVPYQVTTNSMIPRLQVGSVQPGARLQVLVDPANQQRVALDLA